MKIKTLLFCIVLFALSLILRWHQDLPVTPSQALETYNAYSIAQTGRDTNGQFLPLVLRGYDNFPSALSVYFRVPFVALFGLNSTSAFLPQIIVGAISAVLFFLWVRSLKNKIGLQKIKNLNWLGPVGAVLFLLSPWMIFASLFDLPQNLALCLSLGGFLVLEVLITSTEKKTKKILFVFAVFLFCLAVYSSFLSLPFIIVVLAGLYGNTVGKKISKLILSLIIFSAILFLVNGPCRNFVLEQSLFGVINPSQYSYQTDRRLAYDFTTDNIFQKGSFNLNRLVHNKYLYAANGLFSSWVSHFDLELLTSPSQTEELLRQDRESYSVLPKIYFFEIPLMFIGLLILIKGKSKLGWLGIAGLATILLFTNNEKVLFYLMPFSLIAEGVFICWLINYLENRLRKWRYVVLSSLALFWIFSTVTFYSVLTENFLMWVPRNDYIHYQIWNFLQNHAQSYSSITVTDRLDRPISYFLYYMKYPPVLYQKDRAEYLVRSSRYDLMDKVGKYQFAAFKYMESDRKPGQFWIGLAGEFVGKYQPYKQTESVTDGEIALKIKGFYNKDIYWGDEVWFVNTKFEKNDK